MLNVLQFCHLYLNKAENKWINRWMDKYFVNIKKIFKCFIFFLKLKLGYISLHNPWYSVPLLRIPPCTLPRKGVVHKSSYFSKELSSFLNSWLWKWQLTRVTWLFVYLFALQREKKRQACLFSDTQENFARGWFRRNNQRRAARIQAEAASHSGEVVDKGSRFGSLSKRVDCSLNRSLIKHCCDMVYRWKAIFFT